MEQAKRIDTTCRNFVKDFKGKVNIVAFDTENVKDFTNFRMDNLYGTASIEV